MTELSETKESVKRLEPRAIFGINGKVAFGLHLHPDGQHIIFPLGTKIGICNTKTNKQEFIGGHTNNVSCVDLSRSGRYMASGQINHMGFPGYVILYDFAKRSEICRHDLHKVRVQTICFTAEDKYMISAGGRDDGTIIVFDIETLSPISRSVAARSISGNVLAISALFKNPSFFLSVGDRHLRTWSILREQKKLDVHDVYVGKQQRLHVCACIDQNDEYAYIGTQTGDVIKISLNRCDTMNVVKSGNFATMVGAYGTHNNRKPFGKDCDRYVNGLRVVHIIGDGLLLMGAGDGVVELVEERRNIKESIFKNYPSPTVPMLKILKKTKVNGSISSVVAINPIEYYIATASNEIYLLNIKLFTLKLLKTSHKKAVHNIAFPKNLSTVFATAGYETIRIWSTKRFQELLRIMVYNFECAAIEFSYDGSNIVSAWNDGVIRAFTPISGRLIYAIPNAHNKGCSALAISSTGRVLVTGGIEGQVRVWKIEPFRQNLLGVLKDHSGPITSLDFNKCDTEVISASTDGSCVIWDVNRLTRKTVLTANTQFMTAKYIPLGVHVLTCGTDGRIGYWSVYNGSLIRELQGSLKSSINFVAINGTGDYFVSVGSDQLVKLWDYNKGIAVAQGSEHASAVKSAVFSPCGKFFVTGCIDGAIIIWDVPQEYWGKENHKTRDNNSAEVNSVKSEVKIPTSGRSSHSQKQENIDRLVANTPKTRDNNSAEVNSVKSEVKIPTSGRSSHSQKQENIDRLVANTPKNDVCCVECPPVNAKSKVKDDCNIVTDVRKC